ncbi:Cytidine and deoxycytidylate deaminase zinc-binding region [Popillia japonica]|uniref:dCMP deaminase n=1 Tax=Popillia japonica TaxID=7064 RepID=A0AAW1KI08_POPJA
MDSKPENSTIDTNHKRLDYLEWDEYFMAVAFLAAKRMGYNGMPKGCSDDVFPWGKSSNKLKSKYLYVCHAETNAILNKNAASVKNCTMYVALFPCNECAKQIIQSGIKKVVYVSDKHGHKNSTIASKRMLTAAGVTTHQYQPKNKKIEIDFTEVDWDQLPSTPLKKAKQEESP